MQFYVFRIKVKYFVFPIAMFLIGIIFEYFTMRENKELSYFKLYTWPTKSLYILLRYRRFVLNGYK